MAKVYEGRKSKAIKYGAQGAATGLAAGGLKGAAAGALIGGGLGFATGGPTAYERQRIDALDEMLRRQELGMLGLTDEERRALEAQTIDPLRAQQREAETRRLGAMGIGDIGGGAFAKAALADADKMREAEARERQEIAAADVREKNREEAMLKKDLEAQAAQDEQKRAEAMAEAEQQFYSAYESLTMGAELSGIEEEARKAAEAQDAYQYFQSTG